MALATNTTPGSVVLGGDLTGSAFSPSLRPTGVIPGTYGPVDFVVDAKGRLIYARTSTWAEIEPYTSIASDTVFGTMTVGAGLAVSNGTLSLNAPLASATSLGLMQVGTGFTVSGGTVTLNPPIATTSSPGIMQVGSGLSVTGGVVSRTNYVATSDTTLGLMQVGSGLSVTAGVVSLNAPIATGSSTGLMQVGSGMSISGSTLYIADGTSATKGIVNSANTSNITITAGAIDVGPNVGVFDIPNTFTKAQRDSVIHLTAGAQTPNLSLYSVYDCSTNVVSFSAPINAVTGSEMSILGTASTGVVNWSYRTLPSNIHWRSVAWNGTVFCAIGGYGGATTAAATSPDGVTWTARTMPSSQQWVDITWNGTAGVFCAIASNSTAAATSPDGITWTARTLPASKMWFAITTSSTGMMVAVSVATGLYIATSTNGVTWTTRTSPSGVYGTVACDVTWGGSTFCIVTYGYQSVATSPDGITWTERYQVLPTNDGWSGVDWNGSMFCAVAGDSSISLNAATSPDGITWTARTMPSAQQWNEVIWAGTAWVAVTTSSGSNTIYATSADGINWFQHQASVSMNLTGMAWNGSVVCAVGSAIPSAPQQACLTGVYTGNSTITPSTSFSAEYKISGTPSLGQYVLDCVTVGSNTYCQYIQ